MLGIFEEHQDLISPTSTPVCHSLLPYLRLNALRSVKVASDAKFASLGETLRTNPALGSLVHKIEVVDEGKGGQMHTPWLEDSFVAAFDALPNVDTVEVHRTDIGEMLTPKVMQTAAFRSAKTLIISSEDPIPHTALRWLHLSPSLETLLITSPMKYSPGHPSGVFSGNLSSIKKLAINAEPHSADFLDFFEYLQLEELELRSGTADLSRIVEFMGPSTRQTLRSLYFSTTGFLAHRLDGAFLSFASLEHLTLWSISHRFTSEFFASLSPLPLLSLTLLGPNERPFLVDIQRFLDSDERPPTLAELGVDMELPYPSRASTPTNDGERRRASGRSGEDEAKSLEGACLRCNVSLKGSIQQALQVMRER
ncbi:hypothetical protein P7C70_g3231, partial [Phenoliferia sp. Uapishka_3]